MNMNAAARLSLTTVLVVALAGTPRGVCFVGVGSAANSRGPAAAGRRHHAGLGRRELVLQRALVSAVATERRRRGGGRRLAMATIDEEEAIRAAALANVRQRQKRESVHIVASGTWNLVYTSIVSPLDSCRHSHPVVRCRFISVLVVCCFICIGCNTRSWT